MDPILGYIGNFESGNDPYIAYGGAHMPPGLTIQQAADWARQQALKTGSSAIGKYQFLAGTLLDTARKHNIPLDTPFNPQVQDTLAGYKLNDIGYQDFLAGKMTPEQFGNQMAKTWAAFPTPDNKSYYDGVLNNKSQVAYDQYIETLKGLQNGAGAGAGAGGNAQIQFAQNGGNMMDPNAYPGQVPMLIRAGYQVPGAQVQAPGNITGQQIPMRGLGFVPMGGIASPTTRPPSFADAMASNPFLQAGLGILSQTGMPANAGISKGLLIGQEIIAQHRKLDSALQDDELKRKYNLQQWGAREQLAQQMEQYGMGVGAQMVRAGEDPSKVLALYKRPDTKPITQTIKRNGVEETYQYNPGTGKWDKMDLSSPMSAGTGTGTGAPGSQFAPGTDVKFGAAPQGAVRIGSGPNAQVKYLPGSPQALKWQDAIQQSHQLIDEINQLQDLIAKNGSEILPTEAKGMMARLYGDIQTKIRLLAGMGAPQAAELEMLGKQLPDPTTWGSNLNPNFTNMATGAYEQSLQLIRPTVTWLQNMYNTNVLQQPSEAGAGAINPNQSTQPPGVAAGAITPNQPTQPPGVAAWSMTPNAGISRSPMAPPATHNVPLQ